MLGARTALATVLIPTRAAGCRELEPMQVSGACIPGLGGKVDLCRLNCLPRAFGPTCLWNSEGFVFFF